MKQEIKIYDDSNLVEYRTDLEGWTGPNGLYYGKGDLGEERARYANCTHKRCECGNLMDKTWSRCNSCREKSATERWYKRELIKYDGESYLYDETTGRYFSSIEDIFDDYISEDLNVGDARVLLCEQKVGISFVNLDDLNEDSGTEEEGIMSFYPEIQKKVDELNEMIKNATPVLWYPTGKRIDIFDGMEFRKLQIIPVGDKYHLKEYGASEFIEEFLSEEDAVEFVEEQDQDIELYIHAPDGTVKEKLYFLQE